MIFLSPRQRFFSSIFLRTSFKKNVLFSDYPVDEIYDGISTFSFNAITTFFYKEKKEQKMSMTPLNPTYERIPFRDPLFHLLEELYVR